MAAARNRSALLGSLLLSGEPLSRMFIPKKSPTPGELKFSVSAPFTAALVNWKLVMVAVFAAVFALVNWNTSARLSLERFGTLTVTPNCPACAAATSQTPRHPWR